MQFDGAWQSMIYNTCVGYVPVEDNVRANLDCMGKLGGALIPQKTFRALSRIVFPGRND